MLLHTSSVKHTNEEKKLDGIAYTLYTCDCDCPVLLGLKF